MVDENTTNEELIQFCRSRGLIMISEQPQSLEERDLPAPKKFKSLEKTAPSKVTWDNLVQHALVPKIALFFSECQKVIKRIPENLTNPESLQIVKDANDLLYNNCLRNSEEFSMLILGNILACTTNELRANFEHLRLEALPSVFVDEEDKRNNKYCDYKLFTISNECTYVVIELRKDVNVDLHTINSQHLAQLIQEVDLVYSTERRTHMIAVYGNYTYLHIFCLHKSSLTGYSCKAYFSVQDITILPALLIHLFNDLNKDKNYFK